MPVEPASAPHANEDATSAAEHGGPNDGADSKTAGILTTSAASIVKVEPFDLLVFGGTGDLAYRKLYPALFHRETSGQFTDPTRIVGVSRRPLDRDAFRASVKDALVKEHAVGGGDGEALNRFLARLDFVSADATSESGWPQLRRELEADDRIRAFYLATGPDLFCPIARRLGAEGLVTPRARIIVEKPIGRDRASAEAINTEIGSVFAESAIFRIDHYLGKESVQNLMALRFANALLEPVWNSAHIDHVQITVAETLGVEKRGAYYDESGALRDMVQNHMMQLLCLVAMEPPNSMDADALRDEKLKVLKALAPIDDSNAAALTVRGQYRAGFADGVPVPSYLHDIGKHESDTETFVALKVAVANWRWAGAPFYLRSGKRLPHRFSEIVICFRRVPHAIFEMPTGAPANRLVIRVQPDEGIKLWMLVKEPGPGAMRLIHLPLDMSFAKAFGAAQADAYERLLMDAIRGNPALFMRRDEVEWAWRFVDPIRAAWAAMRAPPRPYAAGTWGPASSVALIEREGRTWNEEFKDAD
jgi:glucose-6-phosphate 1-dehydrogenase